MIAATLSRSAPHWNLRMALLCRFSDAGRHERFNADGDQRSGKPGSDDPADAQRYAARPCWPPLPIKDAATTATATTAIRMVQTALISGFTPSRTSE
jgi:hypothetical protein